jgi:molybdopterin/thiamine biosynthesis adenylyltransferase
MGPITGVIGTLMAMEAIKLITGAGEPLAGRLLLYDGRSARFTELDY